MRKLIASALVVLASGCSGGGAPTLDATSEQTVKASVERMTDALPESERPAFVRALARQAMSNALKPGGPYKPLHGLTAAEITARAASD